MTLSGHLFPSFFGNRNNIGFDPVTMAKGANPYNYPKVRVWLQRGVRTERSRVERKTKSAINIESLSLFPFSE